MEENSVIFNNFEESFEFVCQKMDTSKDIRSQHAGINCMYCVICASPEQQSGFSVIIVYNELFGNLFHVITDLYTPIPVHWLSDDNLLQLEEQSKAIFNSLAAQDANLKMKKFAMRIHNMKILLSDKYPIG